MSKTRIYTILMALLATALAAWTAMLWLHAPSAEERGLERVDYGLQEGKRLVQLRDRMGHTTLAVEDAQGHPLFSIPVRNCVLADRFHNGRLAFRMKETGQAGYIDTLGTAYLTSTDTLARQAIEGRNTAQVEPQETPEAQPAQAAQEHAGNGAEARRQSLIA